MKLVILRKTARKKTFFLTRVFVVMIFVFYSIALDLFQNVGSKTYKIIMIRRDGSFVNLISIESRVLSDIRYVG